MKINSTIELNYSAGRTGLKKGVIESEITANKNTEAKSVNVVISDYAIVNTTSSTEPMNLGGRVYVSQSNENMTYQQYDDTLAAIQVIKKYTQTGSELEDMLLHDYLIQKVTSEKWYGSSATNWAKI